jgi:hypothetical protein
MMKIRIAITCVSAPNLWASTRLKAETVIQRTVRIPDLPEGWMVDKVTVLKSKNKQKEEGKS